MRTTRREKQDARRRQEQQYRDNVHKIRPIEPFKATDRVILSLPHRKPEIPPQQPLASQPVEAKQSRNLALVLLAYCLAIVGLGINAWFAYSRGNTVIDKALLSSLGFIAEAVMFYLPDQTSQLWLQRRWGGFCTAILVWPFLFVFAVTNSLGFASINLTEATTVRSERITPAVSDAQRRLDTLSASRRDECIKRGDRCRQLEKEEQLAIEGLRQARNAVAADADPQVASAAKLVTWLSLDRYHPSADDFGMLRLLLLAFLPQLGGLVLMVANVRG